MKQKTQGRVLIALVPASFVFSDYDEYAVISYSFTLRFSSWGTFDHCLLTGQEPDCVIRAVRLLAIYVCRSMLYMTTC